MKGQDNHECNAQRIFVILVCGVSSWALCCPWWPTSICKQSEETSMWSLWSPVGSRGWGVGAECLLGFWGTRAAGRPHEAPAPSQGIQG